MAATPTARSVSHKRSRQPPSPNSILDRQALVQALDEAGLVVKDAHVTSFYQALHRHDYPDLADFFAQYEKTSIRNTATSHPNRLKSSSVDDNDGKDKHCGEHHNNNNNNTIAQIPAPLKSSKNKCRMPQLPQAFVDFLNPKQAQNEEPSKTKTTYCPSSSCPFFVTLTSTVAHAQTSADGSTTKLAVQLHDGQVVESVLMRYYYATTPRDGSCRRASLCVSSQCGCAMGCVSTDIYMCTCMAGLCCCVLP
jgi:hypothetical protein